MLVRSASLRMSCVAAMLSACATQSAGVPDTGDDGQVQHVALAATRVNAGEIGNGVLVGRAHQTDIVLKVSGVPGWVTRPVHLHVFIYPGSCSSMSEQPAYSGTDRVLTRRDGDGFLTLNSTFAVDLSTLREGRHALVIRSSPADANVPLFCGELRPG